MILYVFDDFGPRIVVFVDSMSKTEKNSVFIFDLVDKFRNVFFSFDFLKHSNNSLVSSSMFRSIQSSCSHSDSSIDINSWTSNMSDKRSRAIHFMFSVKYKQNVKSSNQFRMRLESMLVKAVKHKQEVFNITQILSWKIELSTNSVSEWICSDSGYNSK